MVENDPVLKESLITSLQGAAGKKHLKILESICLIALISRI